MVGHSGLESGSDGSGNGLCGRSGRKRIPNRRYMDMELMSPTRTTKRSCQSDASQKGDERSKLVAVPPKAAFAAGRTELRASGSKGSAAALSTSPSSSTDRRSRRAARTTRGSRAAPEASTGANCAVSDSSIGVAAAGTTVSRQCGETLATPYATSLPWLPQAAESTVQPEAVASAADFDKETTGRIVEEESTCRDTGELTCRVAEESTSCSASHSVEELERLRPHDSNDQLQRQQQQPPPGHENQLESEAAAAAAVAACAVATVTSGCQSTSGTMAMISAAFAAAVAVDSSGEHVTTLTMAEPLSETNAAARFVAAESAVVEAANAAASVTDAETVTSRPASLCSYAANASVPVDVAIRLLTADDNAAGGDLTAEPGTAGDSSNADVTLEAESCCNSTEADASAEALAAGVGPAALPVDNSVPVSECRSSRSVRTKRALSSLQREELYVKYNRVSSDGKFRCTKCDYETDRLPNFNKHIVRRHQERSYKCPECEYSARTSSNLKRHMLSHTDERRFSCDRCPLKFLQKIHLEKHVRYIHEAKNVKCSMCDYTCASENPDLKMHMERKHFIADLTTGQRIIIECDRCGFLAVSKRDLKQHYKFHKSGPEMKLYCEQCSFVTDCESRLTRHMLTHSKNKPYGCSRCNYKASQREHIRRHMKNVHQVDVPRPTAGQRRKRSSSAFQESTVVAPDGQRRIVVSKKCDPSDFTETQKVFYCHHCTMQFCKLINLYKHLYAQHANLMPPVGDDGLHGCVLCDFKSTSKKNLLVHMRKHNANALLADTNGAADVVPGEVHTCSLCDYVNPTRQKLYQHLKKKHKISLMVRRDGTASRVVEPNAAVTIAALGKHQQVTKATPMMADDGSGSAHSGKGAEMGRTVNVEELANSFLRPISIPGCVAGMACTMTSGDVEDGSSASDSDGEDDEEDGTAEVESIVAGANGIVTPQATSGSASDSDGEDEDGTAGVEPVVAGAHGIVTPQATSGCDSGSVGWTGSGVDPAIEELMRRQAAEAIVRLAAGVGGFGGSSSSSSSASSATSGYSSAMLLPVAGSLTLMGNEGMRHFQLPANVSSQLSSGDIIEMNGEVFNVIVAPQNERDGGPVVQVATAFGVASAGTSLLL